MPSILEIPSCVTKRPLMYARGAEHDERERIAVLMRREAEPFGEDERRVAHKRDDADERKTRAQHVT
jgi:hypothetical protein